MWEQDGALTKKGPPLHRCATNDRRHRTAAMQLMRYSTWKVCCGTALLSSCRGGQKESVVSLPVSCARVSCCSWPRFYPHSLVASRHSDTLSSCPCFSFSLIKLRNKGRHSPWQQRRHTHTRSGGAEGPGERTDLFYNNVLSQTENQFWMTSLNH